MITKISEFKVKKESIAEAKSIIKEFSIKASSESRTLAFDTYMKDDGVSFLFFMSFDSDDAEEFHNNTDYMKLFTSKLYPLCEEEPKFTTLTKF